MRKLSPAQLKQQSEKALEHDKNTCQFCGFRSTQYQRTIPWTVKGRSLPLVTACTFCEQCLFLERAGAMGSGYMIWLPEMTQVELNHLVRAIYIARADKDKAKALPAPNADKDTKPPEDDSHDMTAAADRALAALLARRSDAKRRLGSDDPMLLATIMHENMSSDDLKSIGKKLDGIRLIAMERYLVRGPNGDTNQFPKLVQFWKSASGPYAKMPADKWPELFRGALSGATEAATA